MVFGFRYVPCADKFGAAGLVSAMASAAFRLARMDVPRYRGGDVAAWYQYDATQEELRTHDDPRLELQRQLLVPPYAFPLEHHVYRLRERFRRGPHHHPTLSLGAFPEIMQLNHEASVIE